MSVFRESLKIGVLQWCKKYKRGGTAWDRHNGATEEASRREERMSGGHNIPRNSADDRAEQEIREAVQGIR